MERLSIRCLTNYRIRRLRLTRLLLAQAAHHPSPRIIDNGRPRQMAHISIRSGVFAAVLLFPPFAFADGGPRDSPKLTDAQCVKWISLEIHSIHPSWDLKGLRARRSLDMSFYPGEPEYHVVEVMTADQSDSNPIGPVI